MFWDQSGFDSSRLRLAGRDNQLMRRTAKSSARGAQLRLVVTTRTVNFCSLLTGIGSSDMTKVCMPTRQG
jgi:hypothetical protein